MSNNDNPWGSGPKRPKKQDSIWDKKSRNSLDLSNIENLFGKKGANLKGKIPNNIGGWPVFLSIGILILLIWLATGFYKVEPDEQGVVLRFGKWVRSETPGLHYHLPAPIERALTPKVTFVYRTEIGYRSINDTPVRAMRNRIRTRAANPDTSQDVTSESLMLTGDENIIDIDFAVLWVIKDAGKFLFKVRDPEGTVKQSAESAMREVIGRTDLIPALTGGRQKISQDVQTLLQQMLDDYGTGIEITKVDIQDSSPPEAVIDAFNDVQRARADLVRLRNQAESYRNKILPEARGQAEQIIQNAEAYKQRVINLSEGEASRFKAVLDAYRTAPKPTRDRMYLETIEQVLKDHPKLVFDSARNMQGVLPYLPVNQLNKKSRKQKAHPLQPSVQNKGKTS